jgi:hypothetical protein
MTDNAVAAIRPEMVRELELWFFRDISNEQRLKLFALYGMPVDEIGNVHGRQKPALRHVVSILSAIDLAFLKRIEALEAEKAKLLRNAKQGAALLNSYHALLTKHGLAPSTSDLYPVIEYQSGEWFKANTIDEMQAFYVSRLPSIRAAAQEHGYAIGVHGSARRDFDLIAIPWREGASDQDVLAHAIAAAACGISRDGPYQWEEKPAGRVATSIPICWTAWHDMISAGHIDLSLIPPARTTLTQGGHNV